MKKKKNPQHKWTTCSRKLVILEEYDKGGKKDLTLNKENQNIKEESASYFDFCMRFRLLSEIYQPSSTVTLPASDH